MTKFAVAMIAYALALLGIGTLTYLAAPPGATAITALIVPGVGAVVAIACVILAFQIHTRRTLGMVGIHFGMLVPVILAAGAFARLPASLSKNAAYYQKQSISLPTESGTQVTLSSAKDHPTGYQAVGIGSVGVVSVFAFITVLMLRPKPPSSASTRPLSPASSPASPTPPPGPTSANAPSPAP